MPVLYLQDAIVDIGNSDLATINEKLLKRSKLSNGQKEKILGEAQSVMKIWHSSVEVQRANGGLDSMIEEFPYLKPVIVRYEGDASKGIEGGD